MAGCVLAAQTGGSLREATVASLLAAASSLVLKLGFKRERLTVREGLQDAIIVGALAASATSNLKVWQPPADWQDLFSLTGFAVCVSCLAYFASMAYTLAARGRHLSLKGGACLAAAPYLFNWLLLLQSPELLRELGRLLTWGSALSPELAETIGRAAVLVGFNELLAGGIHLVMTGRWIREGRYHCLLAASALVTVLTPALADWGSRPELASWPRAAGVFVAVAVAIPTMAGLWAQIYLLTGAVMHALHGRKPGSYWGAADYRTGLAKGAVYSGVFMCVLHGAALFIMNPSASGLIAGHPLLFSLAVGASAFPLLKTIIESFDDSERFFLRLKRNYLDGPHYFRGAVLGLGIGYGIVSEVPGLGGGPRFLFGFAVGLAAYAGVNLAQDTYDLARGRRTAFQSWRVYLLAAILGGFVGGALAWYLDQAQLEVIREKFRQYTALHFTAIGKDPQDYVVYPLFSKWGAMDLGTVSGGVRLFYSEAVCGVINWSLAAPLFGVNLVLLTALFQWSSRPLRQLFTRQGVVELVEQTVRVQRWGLWMAPVIFSFLRMAPTPTWYNQDGAVRTVLATSKALQLGPEGFHAWSLKVFTQMLAYDWLRILIWLDHMGLRVATLVNLSFIGGDALDRRAARFVGHTSRTHSMPEGVRRFATWAPLLIPFYLPRGGDWDMAWGHAEAMQEAMGQGPNAETVLLIGMVLAALGVGIYLACRRLQQSRKQPALRRPMAEYARLRRFKKQHAFQGEPDQHVAARRSLEERAPPRLHIGKRVRMRPRPKADAAAPSQAEAGPETLSRVAPEQTHSLGNGVYTLELAEDSRGYSRVFSSVRHGVEIDLTRRHADPLQLAGRPFYLTDCELPEKDPGRVWSLGLSPAPGMGVHYLVEQTPAGGLRFVAVGNGLRAEAEVRVADRDPVEIWRVRLINLGERPRELDLTSYREFTMNTYGMSLKQNAVNSLHIGTRFVRSHNAILAQNRLLKDGRRDVTARRLSGEVAFHAVRESSDGTVRLLGYEDSRVRFIGPETLRRPAALGRPLRSPDDEGLLYTFDPVAGLRVRVLLAAGATVVADFVDGYGRDLTEALGLIERFLQLPRPDTAALQASLSRRRILAGFESAVEPITGRELRRAEEPAKGAVGHGKQGYGFSADGTELRLGWDTPRSWTHHLANRTGYGAVAANDGNIYSFMGNSQQNAITTPHFDSMTAQVPGQILYFRDLASGESGSPTYIPFRNKAARYGITYGRGYATFTSSWSGLQTKMTAFLLPDEPAEVRLVRVRNTRAAAVTLRVVPYFQIVLGEVAEDTRGKILARYDEDEQVLFFSNPQNDFQRGWAFFATSLPVEGHETVRSRFVGEPGRDLGNPVMLENGLPDSGRPDDGFRIASFASTVTIPAGDEVKFCFLLGQAESVPQAERIIRSCREVQAAELALERTRHWWQKALSVLRVETDHPAFDRLVNDWLPYQILTSRLWGRCGRRQRSGGYGFRDQLQDVLPLVFLDPAIARQQILLHGAQQFIDGDVMQWWHPSRDGRTGVGARNRASDPHLWLPYVVAHYLAATGDLAILEEPLPFLEAGPIPRGSEGYVVVPRISREERPLLVHCLRAVDLTLERMGPNGLPLIGTGDWNDGLSTLGFKGKGESVWLGFFLHDILVRLADLLDREEHRAIRQRYRAASARLRVALNRMWRWDRYVRAVADDGRELAFADALSAAWPVISGAADFERGCTAVETGIRELEKDGLLLLLYPPFDEDSPIQPGRIADYPPGVRENGGQYSHGSSWMIDALLRLSEQAVEVGSRERAVQYREKAVKLWMKISQLSRSNPDAIRRYGLPPHQQAADVYFGYGYEGRGGWAWYTGAAGRMLAAAYAILGLRMRQGRLEVSEDFWEVKGPLTPKRLSYRGNEYRRPAAADEDAAWEKRRA